MSDWISVKDQLPPKGVPVLVCFTAGGLMNYDYTVTSLFDLYGTGIEKKAIRMWGDTVGWKLEFCNPMTKVEYWQFIGKIPATPTGEPR